MGVMIPLVLANKWTNPKPHPHPTQPHSFPMLHHPERSRQIYETSSRREESFCWASLWLLLVSPCRQKNNKFYMYLVTLPVVHATWQQPWHEKKLLLQHFTTPYIQFPCIDNCNNSICLLESWKKLYMPRCWKMASGCIERWQLKSVNQ